MLQLREGVACLLCIRCGTQARHVLAHQPSAPLCAILSRRLLDPQLSTSYPSAILARERAIVINLEFIKAIIAMGAWLPGCRWRRHSAPQAARCCFAPARRGLRNTCLLPLL